MTHVIFAHPHHDSATEFAAAVAAFCRPGDSVTRVDEDVYAPKGSPDATYLAAFADFDPAAFVRLVQAVPWEFPTAVSAFVRPAGATRFEALDLRLQFDVGRNRKLAAAHGWSFPVDGDQAEFLAKSYPAMLDRSRDLIRARLRNPHLPDSSYDVLASVPTGTPWVFECVRISPERRSGSGTRHEFGPGKDDWRWINVQHRTVYADLAVRGVYFQLMCDEADVGPTTFEQVRAAAEPLKPGDRVRIAGVIDVRADGECVIGRVGRLDRVDDHADAAGEAGR